VLVAFKPNRFGPVGVDALILGKSGQLYGATASGGAYLKGSIFELIPNNGKWTEQLLFSFKDRTDAELPDGNSFLTPTKTYTEPPNLVAPTILAPFSRLRHSKSQASAGFAPRLLNHRQDSPAVWCRGGNNSHPVSPAPRGKSAASG
jgi:hypothetical protein